MTDLYEFLDEHRIGYQRCDHPPVFTCEEAERLVPDMPAAKTKNLFLRDNKGRRHFLVIVGYEKTVDLKALRDVLGSSKLSLGSQARLEKYLGVNPGAVSLLALINDKNQDVEVVFDAQLWQSKAFRFHPLVNSSTLAVSRDNIERFLSLTGHTPRILDVPDQK
ncbi:prolyl-tRNA synthetase associated domain-containing protein [candidate division KSB1 bacterium]|nr:prolyl-tRNA synthetase associated domain-containing protein [candidate division KSB1 bacterium]NIR69727.1 prolyl-tRNA synthetase associated domain-containing protein [candidate division KSB1 bacterium]NIS22915.1 prolyl-tRNA synthetase associated domain-containing protein [candidate division KSB1 bacterium]NIT69772.1 prolyl-tRNA synthetase associated domain-containing protein [candidate division KSB1 bacterium]NIU23446.1 prolyl-tRNA synthetase associated domain-containing protein [candidate d